MRGRSWSQLAAGLIAGLVCTGIASAGPAAHSGTLLFAAELGNAQLYTWRIGEVPRRVTADPSANSFDGVLSPDGTQIAFDRGRDIYVIQRDGTGMRRLTQRASYNFQPAWSPNGRRLAFATTRFGKAEAMVMNADGTRVVRITHNHVNDFSPSWSPDGRRLVVVRNVDRKHAGLWIVRVDGRDERMLTHGKSDWDADWSPDGKRIAFTRFVGKFSAYPNGDLMVVNRDGRHLRRLTQGKAQDFSPSWSPDGRQLVFERDNVPGTGFYVIGADGGGLHTIEPLPGIPGYEPSWGRDATIVFWANLDGNPELQLADVGGTTVTTLTDNDVLDYNARWSPDGSRIAFTRQILGVGGEIFVMNADGNGATNLTQNDAHDDQPAWSPDGKKLVFVSYPNEINIDSDIFVMNADGTKQQRLTFGNARDFHPDWSPDGAKIAFAREQGSGAGDVWVVNADGTDARPLTSDEANEGQPTWSPDGKKLLFVRERGGRTEIWVMNADGSDQQPLIVDSVDVREPAWSPDGSQITYDRFAKTGAAVYAANAAGLDRQFVAVACGTKALEELESEAHCHEKDLTGVAYGYTPPSPRWRP